jgi:hypothetical protein
MARIVVPLLAGAVAAAACVLLLGWPERPALPGQGGVVAAAALAVVAVLAVFVPAVRPRRPQPPRRRVSEVARDRLVPPRPHADRAHRRPGELFDPLHVGPRVRGEIVEGPAGGEVLEPAR